MAKPKRYYYECVLQCDLPYVAPDQRRERWPKNNIAPMCIHSKRLVPSDGYTTPDFIVTDKPVARQYTEEVVKAVSRPDFEHPGARRRIMREKVSKIKLRLLDSDEVGETVRRTAIDLPWADALFTEATQDVILSPEMQRLAAQGAAQIGKSVSV